MILVDLNVLVDVIQRREPYFTSSVTLVERIARGALTAAVSAHAVTTLHYLVFNTVGQREATDAVVWVLRNFVVIPIGPTELERARSFDWPDFEDAVVAAAAETSGCTVIITRNVRDFAGSPVPAMPPEELRIDEIHEELLAGYRVPANQPGLHD